MSIERIVTADKIVSVATTVEDRHIDFQDILDCINVEPDDCCNDPFDDCVLEHEAVKERWDEHDDRSEYANNRVWDRYNGRQFIEVEHDADLYRWYRKHGASRQVAFEKCAEDRRRRIDAIIKIYDEGYEVWYVSGEFKGASAGVGGVHGDDYADNGCRHEIAHEIASELEKDGYIIDGKPDYRAEWLKNRIESIRHNARLFNTNGR